MAQTAAQIEKEKAHNLFLDAQVEMAIAAPRAWEIASAMLDETDVTEVKSRLRVKQREAHAKHLTNFVVSESVREEIPTFDADFNSAIDALMTLRSVIKIFKATETGSKGTSQRFISRAGELKLGSNAVLKFEHKVPKA
jgi:hypothetical protein